MRVHTILPLRCCRNAATAERVARTLVLSLSLFACCRDSVQTAAAGCLLIIACLPFGVFKNMELPDGFLHQAVMPIAAAL